MLCLYPWAVAIAFCATQAASTKFNHRAANVHAKRPRGFLYLRTRMQTVTIFNSTITCPVCGYQKEEAMPTDACQYFYECENCKTILKPKPGDCCVFCSYGTAKCPPMQQGESCCQKVHIMSVPNNLFRALCAIFLAILANGKKKIIEINHS